VTIGAARILRVTMTPTVLHHMIVSSVDLIPTFVFPWKPNAAPQPPPKAGAQRTLEGVGCRHLFGPGSAKDTAPPQLFPNPDAMDFDYEKLPCILLHGGMKDEVIG